MTKAVLVAFHQYTLFGSEFYQPIFDFFIKNYREIWGKEVDKLYILASNWNVEKADDYTVIQTDPSLRYYDAYKQVLRTGMITEDLVMFMDNDMVVYRKELVQRVFMLLGSKLWEKGEELGNIDVVSIFDTIGTYKTDKLNGKNKFCPYWFATRKELLMKYLDVDWSPDMPYCETLGHLTEAMLADGLRPYEFPEDKSNCLFDGIQDGEKGKDLGYYHVRSGSTPAYLLATKKYGDRATYDSYLKNQPKNEYLRHCAWYQYMGGNPYSIIADAGLGSFEFKDYYQRFLKYHNLP